MAARLGMVTHPFSSRDPSQARVAPSPLPRHSPHAHLTSSEAAAASAATAHTLGETQPPCGLKACQLPGYRPASSYPGGDAQPASRDVALSTSRDPKEEAKLRALYDKHDESGCGHSATGCRSCNQVTKAATRSIQVRLPRIRALLPAAR